MIEINLIKKEKKKDKTLTVAVSPKFQQIKAIKVEDLIKLDKSVYYISLVFWLTLLVSGFYYYRLLNEKETLVESLEKIKVKKAQLEAKRKDVIEKEKQIQENIKAIQTKIEELEKSKDILLGLRSYYLPFKNNLYFYTMRIPSGAWIYEYKQNIDFSANKIHTEIKFASLDPNSIGFYGNLAKVQSSKYYITNIERKIGQYGYAYYTADIKLEDNVIKK